MASATTVNEVQAIKTLNNLNMEGKFVESSLRQFTNLNTATIIYGDSIQDGDSIQGAASGSTVTLYDAITEQNIDFKLRTGSAPGTNEYQRQSTADDTAQKLVDSINSHPVPNNNEYSAIIEYFADLNNATANDTITLYNYDTAVVFTMISSTPSTPSATDVQFEKGNDVDATATNLATAINNHSAFSAILDKYSTLNKGRIIITQTSSSGRPTDNTNNFEDGDTNTELKLTNFSNFSATIDRTNNTITVIQNSSKSYNSNSTSSEFSTSQLSVTNFKVNSGDEAAISSETIGTYQILNKVITDLSILKKKITDRNKILQKDLSNDVDDVDHVTLSSNDTTATHQSNITADKSRGNLNETTSSDYEKPSVFGSATIFYSEDALFTLLKGLGYEIFKFKNGITGSNNGVGSTYAGLSEIPISISPQTPHTSGIATLPNIAATIHNINRSGTINTTENTSAGSIPEGTSNTNDGVGLIQLINTIINNITLIKRSIKTRELLILEKLKTSNFLNPPIDVANYDSKVPSLKTRGDLLDDTGGGSNDSFNLHKPSIFNSGSNKYSEDAVFGLFSCLSYELMKLLNFKNGSNNGGNIEHAGLALIPASIESI